MFKNFSEYLYGMYNFSLFSVQLNEPESNVAPTDSRFRPDQRLMEDTKCKFYLYF